MVKNFERKTFFFGDPKIASAKDSSGNLLYEVIYVDIVDPLEKEKQSVAKVIQLKNGFPIDVSQNKYQASTNLITVDQLIDKLFYPSTVSNMQEQLKDIVSADGSSLIQINENFLPIWMQTTQEDTGTALGYVKAVPIVYVQPGQGVSTLERIKDTGFDFKNISFDVDRLIIDSVEGQAGDKYIAFPIRKVV